MKVYAIVEGETEKRVLEKLESFVKISIEITSSNGKRQLNKTIIGKIGPLINLERIRVVVLRDLDLNDNETISDLVYSTETALSQTFQMRGITVEPKLQPLNRSENVYVWNSEELDFGLALHVATYRWNESFIKATIDDYILDLALDPVVAGSIAQSQKLDIEGERLIIKVAQELPELLHKNGIPLVEAKDYVRLYAAIVKAHTSPQVFAQKVLNRNEIDERVLRDHFKSLFTALEFLR